MLACFRYSLRSRSSSHPGWPHTFGKGRVFAPAPFHDTTREAKGSCGTCCLTEGGLVDLEPAAFRILAAHTPPPHLECGDVHGYDTERELAAPIDAAVELGQDNSIAEMA